MKLRLLPTLYLAHRWLGIAIGVLVLGWFASGVVMMYVPYPQLTQAERRAALTPLVAAQVTVSAALAWQATGLSGAPESVRLANLATLAAPRPAYVFFSSGQWRVVWADSGAVRTAVSEGDAARAAQAMRGGKVSAIDTIDVDQWSLGGLDAHRPLFRVALDDAAGSVLYVSSRTGEVVRDTARGERIWNWMGSVIHWIYFAPLRTERALWRQVVMWTSAGAFALAVTGTVIGMLRLRLRRRYSRGRISPYQGWKRWHHLIGMAIALVALTWLFSGWLSVNPFAWFAGGALTRADQLALAGGELGRVELSIAPAALLARQPAPVVEIDWLRFAGQGYVRLYGQQGDTARLLLAQDFSPATLSVERLRACASRLRRQLPIAGSAWLEEGDLYYYRHHDDTALPVLRVDFADADHTSFYLDPASGTLVAYADSKSRLYRWLFNGLHRLDFPLLTRHRPLWDVLVIVLCLCGVALSVSGLVLGWRRLKT